MQAKFRRSCARKPRFEFDDRQAPLNMENKAYALAAGLFLLVMGLALAVTAAWFQGDRVERVRYTVVARGGVPGLNLKAAVKLRGVEVGKVESIAFDPAQPRRILVGLSVDKSAPVTVGTYAQLGLQGVTGLSFVNLEEAADAPATRAAAGALIELRPTLLDRLAESGPGLLAGFAESAQRLNGLLSDENRRQLTLALKQSGDAAQEAARLMAALQTTARALPGTLQRTDAVIDKFGASLAQFDALALQARGLAQELRDRAAAIDRLGAAAQQIEASSRNLELALAGPAPRTRPLLDDLSAASAAVERTAGGLGEQPQSLLFGRRAVLPGPGESGFAERLKAP